MIDITNRMSQYIKEIKEIVVKHGHAIQYVGEGETSPSFSYTIGLFATLGFELFTIGLPPMYAEPILNMLADMLKKTPIADNIDINDLAEGYPARLVTLDPKEVYQHVGVLYRCTEPQGLIPVRQLVYPDREGYWPWDWKYDLHVTQKLDQLDDKPYETVH